MRGNYMQRDTMRMNSSHARTSPASTSGNEHEEVEHSCESRHAHKETERTREQRAGVCEYPGVRSSACEYQGSEEHEFARERMPEDDASAHSYIGGYEHHTRP